MKGKSILIVCAEFDFILIDKILRDEYLLDRLYVSKEMGDISVSKHYDLVLLDIFFFDIDYWDVKAFIKQIPSTIPIILLTSDHYGLSSKRLTELGGTDFFLKPIRRKELLGIVRKWTI